MPFALTHNMPLTFGKFFTCMCTTWGINRNPPKSSEEITAPEDSPELQGEVKAESQYGMEPETEQAILDVLKITNPGVEDPEQIPFSDLPDLRQEMNGCRPNTTDDNIDDICRITTSVERLKSTANDSLTQNTLEVTRSVHNLDHVWFAIRYLFALLDRTESLMAIKKKRTTALPKYQLYLKIVLRWSCEVYLKKRSNLDFINNFMYAISHGNSILKKADIGTKRQADQAGTSNIENTRVFKLQRTLLFTDGYVANSGSVANSGLVYETESDDSDV